MDEPEGNREQIGENGPVELGDQMVVEGGNHETEGRYRMRRGDVPPERFESAEDARRRAEPDQPQREYIARARVFRAARDGEIEEQPEEVIRVAEFGEREAAAGQFALREVRPRLQSVHRLFDRLGRYSPVPRWELLAEDYQDLLPVMVSRVAQRFDGGRKVAETTVEDLKKIKPALRATRLLGKRLGAKADRLAVRKAHEAMDQGADRVVKATEFFEKISPAGEKFNPKQQFVREVAGLYQGMVDSGLPAGDYLHEVVGRLSDIRHGRDSSYMPAWAQQITSERYPMLVHSDDLELPITSMVWQNKNKINAGGPELADGLAYWLENHGVRDVPTNSVPSGSLLRGLAPQRTLESVRRQVPQVMDGVLELLPEDGAAFAAGTRAFFYDADWLARRDKTGADLRRLVFPDGERRNFTNF